VTAEPRLIAESIPAALGGERVNLVVALLAEVSRRDAVDMISSGAVLLDGTQPEKPSVRVEPDAEIEISVSYRDEGLAAEPSVESLEILRERFFLGSHNLNSERLFGSQ